MKKLLLTIALVGALAPSMARAQDAPTTLKVPVPATNLASVTPFIVGLKEPQGLLRDSNGDVIVCDYGAGEVLRFSKTGANKAVLASDLKGPSQIIPVLSNLVISERKANRVISLSQGKKVTPVGGEIIEPMGFISQWQFVNFKNQLQSSSAVGWAVYWRLIQGDAKRNLCCCTHDFQDLSIGQRRVETRLCRARRRWR